MPAPYASTGFYNRDPAGARVYSVAADGDRHMTMNFALREYAQRGTDRFVVYPALQSALQALRTRFGTCVILSAYRTTAHNATLGGDPNSLHLYGMAADIQFPAYAGGEAIASYARDVLGMCVGLHPTGKMHVSVGAEGGADRTIIQDGYIQFRNFYPGGVDRQGAFATVDVVGDRALYGGGQARLAQAGGGLVGGLALVVVGLAVMRETGALPGSGRILRT